MVPISSLPSQTAAGTVSIDSAVIHQTPRGHSHGRPISVCWVLSCGAGLLERGRAHRPSPPRIETAVVAGTALCRAYHGGSGHWPWQKQSCALARAGHCPSPSPQGLDGHSTPESDKYKKTVPLVLTLTHPDLILKPIHSLSLPNASLLFVDPFVTAYIPRYCRRLPVCFSLSSGLGQWVLTAVSIDSAIVLNLRASIVQELTICVFCIIYTFLPKANQNRSGSCSLHKRLTTSVALLRPSPTCWASAPS